MRRLKSVGRHVMAALAALFTVLPLCADTAIVDGIEWTYSVKDGKAVIEKEWSKSWFSSGLCNDDELCYEAAVGTDSFLPSTVTIPAKLNGYPVVRIGVAAFFGVSLPYTVCDSSPCHQVMEKVKIPSGVTSIGDCAFAGCRNLSSVEVPASVTEIGACAFTDCASLKKVTLPMWCKNFRHYVPEYGREVGILEYAFENCPSSMKVTYKGRSGASGVEVAELWQKAHTADGVVLRDGKVVGIIQIKIGKLFVFQSKQKISSCCICGSISLSKAAVSARTRKSFRPSMT